MEENINGERYHFSDRQCVFICSPYNGNIEKNIVNAKRYARYAAMKGNAVFVPHLLYPQFLDDSNDYERNIGIQSGIEFLWFCDEIWVFAKNENLCSEGMKKEIEEAKKNPGMKIVFIDPINVK